MSETMKGLVATVKRVFAAFWAWALRHEIIASALLTLLLGLAVGGAAAILDFFLVA